MKAATPRQVARHERLQAVVFILPSPSLLQRPLPLTPLDQQAAEKVILPRPTPSLLPPPREAEVNASSYSIKRLNKKAKFQSGSILNAIGEQ